jgi:hypothetical protein
MHLSLEHGFDVSWGNRQGEVLFTVSGDVEMDEDGQRVRNIRASGFFECPRTGRDVKFDESDLSSLQWLEAAELLLDEAERRERWTRRTAAAPMADAGTTWRER